MKLPRFNLRDLFWLVLVVGMGCAWWQSRMSAERAAKAVAEDRDAWKGRAEVFERYLTEDLGVRISTSGYGFYFPAPAVDDLLQKGYGWKYEGDKLMPPADWPNERASQKGLYSKRAD